MDDLTSKLVDIIKDNNRKRNAELKEEYKNAIDSDDPDPETIFNLARCYHFGKGGETDIPQAIELYQKSVDLNNHRAMVNLAILYYNGEFVKKDMSKVIDLLQRAVELNNPDAITSLAMCYYKGEGVEKDIFKSKELFQRATDLNDDKAMRCLAHYKEEFDNFI